MQVELEIVSDDVRLAADLMGLQDGEWLRGYERLSSAENITLVYKHQSGGKGPDPQISIAAVFILTIAQNVPINIVSNWIYEKLAHKRDRIKKIRVYYKKEIIFEKGEITRVLEEIKGGTTE